MAEAIARSPRLRRVRNRALRNAASALLVTALFGVVEVELPEKPPGAFLAMVLCAGLFVKYARTVLLLSTGGGIRRAARKAWSRSEVAQLVHEATIAEDRLAVRTDKRGSTYAWEIFGELVETEDQFLLLERSGEPGVSLPKRGLADPSLVPACRSLLASCLEAPRSPQRGPLSDDEAGAS
ncbi:hypothetical protein [Peterkaempfera sp. SMS 1(5)a]|uniref:hypothetical protein n=1 Tax=Peterkaempfera podocarpi TaxID=3232308 RepID=UPI00366DC90D